jgi:hypothetical protein
MIPRLDRLVEAVQTNCHIADARHAGDLTLCTYLLEMREFYRWEHGTGFTEQPPRAQIGAWIAEREALWESLAEADFQPLPIDDSRFGPFDSAAINEALAPHGLVYGAGIERFGKPQFFLGELKRLERRRGLQILVAGREYARNLAAAPATLQDTTIQLRQESLRRWLWEKFEAWGVKKPGGALHATLLAYGFDLDPQAALARMADAESETLILHELGEFEAGLLLGGEWRDMCAGFTRRRTELVARALRDNLADCLVTLPTLLDRGAAASIHFWMSNFDGLRRELAPGLAHAYAAWCEGDQGPLAAAVDLGRVRCRDLCDRALALHRCRGADAQGAIEALVGATLGPT